VFVLWDERPEGRGPPSGGLGADSECAEGQEFIEGNVDSVALEMPMKEAPDLILQQPTVGYLIGLTNTVGDGVAGGHAEEEGGTVVAVIPWWVRQMHSAAPV
jgi:hypothetical protein